MSLTEIIGEQISNASLQKRHIDIITVGESLITNIVAGVGISITGTGADVGTGAVTIQSSAVDGSVRTFELETLAANVSSGAVMTLPNSKVYVANGHSLELFLNGTRLYNTVDFTETSTTTITILRDLFIGDELLWYERHGYEPSDASGLDHSLLSNLAADGHTQYHTDSRALTWLQSKQKNKEIPTGLINGINTNFTLANIPVAGSEHVYVNGILMDEGATDDYVQSGVNIIFNTAPATGWRIVVSYIAA